MIKQCLADSFPVQDPFRTDLWFRSAILSLLKLSAIWVVFTRRFKRFTAVQRIKGVTLLFIWGDLVYVSGRKIKTALNTTCTEEGKEIPEQEGEEDCVKYLVHCCRPTKQTRNFSLKYKTKPSNPWIFPAKEVKSSPHNLLSIYIPESWRTNKIFFSAVDLEERHPEWHHAWAPLVNDEHVIKEFKRL